MHRTTKTAPQRLLPTLVVLVATACAPAPEGPDLILTEGAVHVGVQGETATALAVDGSRIVALGSDAEIRALAVDDTQEMALDGAAVYGGFVDHWVDVEALGRWQEAIDLRLTASTREVQARVRERLAADGGWILGHGWDETVWPSNRLPDRSTLDAVTSDRPVLLYRRSGDVGWVNGVALERAGLDPSTPGVLLDRQGRPSGIVAGPALARVEERLPVPDTATQRGWFAEGLRQVAAAGITTVFTAPVDRRALESLRRLRETGDLPVRVRVRLRPDAAEDAPDLGAGDRSEEADIRVVALGLTLDGPFRPPLAAVSEPYADGDNGDLWEEAASVERACAQAERLGLDLHVRARGDRAVATALRACPALRAGSGLVVGGDLLPSPADQLSGMRLVASPGRMIHDLYWIEDVLGPDRGARTHRYRDALAAGILTGLASEAPEHPLSPMEAIRALATRRDREGYPLDGWLPGQRVAVSDSIRIATAELREGGVADLVVWSSDPAVSVGDLAATRAMVTIVGGRVVYSRPLVELPFEIQ